MRILILLLFLFGCSTTPKINYDKARALLELIKERDLVIHPGHLRLVSFPHHPGFKNSVVVCEGQKYPLYLSQGQLKAYLAESYFSKRKSFKCLFETKIDGALFTRNAYAVSVRPYRYKSGRLYVDKKKLWLSKEDLARVKQEKRELAKIYSSPSKEVLFTEKFVRPLPSKITSSYGAKRVYNNKKKSPHLGTDFRAAVGVPIPAANRGRVVYVRDLFFSGNTVIIDHGLGVFTTYSHMSEIKAKVGDMVEKGTIVGLAGKTGRVSGPHLHWGVKIHGNWVSGLVLVEEGI